MKLYDYQQDLVNRTRQSYIEGFNAPCIVSGCGSGKSVMIAEVARMTAKNRKNVLFLVHRKELLDQIKGTFSKVGVDFRYVTFGMVMTIVNKLEKIPKPELIITDENHHGLANSYRKIYDYFKDVKKLGFTATPIRLNGNGLGDINDVLIEGPSVKWLIENERLSPFDYYAPKLINNDVLKKASTGDFTKQSMDIAIEKMIYGDVIKHYKQLADNEQAITYCHSIEASKHTADIFNQAGYKASHIDAKTPKEERAEIINKFRAREIKILCNVDLIGEGFDVPDCSSVIMLRPTKSLSLYIQQSMRGMRYQPNKRSVIIDHVGNVASFGLPDAEREWHLHGKKKVNNESDLALIECKECFMVFEKNDNRECPHCGWVHPIEIRESELETDEEAELEKITETSIVLNFKKPSDCQNMTELHELAKVKGYKSGWVYHQAKFLGIK